MIQVYKLYFDINQQLLLLVLHITKKDLIEMVYTSAENRCLLQILSVYITRVNVMRRRNLSNKVNLILTDQYTATTILNKYITMKESELEVPLYVTKSAGSSSLVRTCPWSSISIYLKFHQDCIELHQEKLEILKAEFAFVALLLNKSTVIL